MSFVNELISADDKNKIDWTKFMWSQHADSHRPWKWTIDREKDVFLVGLTGPGRESDHPAIYALSWKGWVVRFSAKVTGGGPVDILSDLYWDIFDVDISEDLEINRQEILCDLKEAVDAFGTTYNRTGIKSVFVKII